MEEALEKHRNFIHWEKNKFRKRFTILYFGGKILKTIIYNVRFINLYQMLSQLL